MGDDLKFIDFHQLQIDNKKYVKEIDEKNRKLLTLKSSTGKLILKELSDLFSGKIVTRLINEKKRLNFEVEQGKKYQAEITEKKNNIKNLQDVIASVEEERKKENDLLYRLRGQKERYQKAPQVIFLNYYMLNFRPLNISRKRKKVKIFNTKLRIFKERLKQLCLVMRRLESS